MAKGSNIIVSNAPRGTYWEGVLTGALLPGTIVQIKVSAGLDDDGNPSFEAYNAALDGDRRPLFVLLPDIYQGRDELTAYTTGTRCRVYMPLAGDQLNVVSDAALTFGDLLIVDDGTGKVLATTGTPESEPFQALKTVGAVANQLVHVLVTGF